MKKTLLYLTTISAMAFTSCSEEVEKTSLQQLESKRDSLKTEARKLNSEIKEIEKEIALLDPSHKLYTVTAVKGERKLFKHYVEVQGTVNSDQSITMYAESGGKVLKVYTEEGQRVKKGQVLVKFDSEVLEKNLRDMETSLELARTTAERQKKLWDQNIGSEMEYLRSQSNLESLESKKAALQAQIKMSKVIAPFSGVVDQIFVKEGEMAGMSAPALRLINLDDIYIEADVSERYLSAVKKGTEAVVTFPNMDEKLTAKVSMTGNYIKPSNRTFRIVIDLENIDNKIKPNQLAVVNLLDIEKEGVTIPSNVILNSPDGSSYVYVIKSNSTPVVTKTKIEVGPSYNGETLVYGGIDENALLADKGSRSVQDGQEVKVEK